ncbi:MAG: GNAT family N-acetyltransferase [Clostridia bacterium]|nr:GNAT family N-acetyltransferase [Clostridia bacterium]
MKIRISKKSDIDSIMVIIADARQSLGKLGIDQWQYGYPSRDIVKEDIVKGQSYVVCDDIDGKEQIIAVFTTLRTGEPTYEQIFEGQWNTSGRYFALHRIAISKKYRYKGLGKHIIDYIKSLCRDNNVGSIRVDTHTGNIPMRKMLEKNGFEYCGIIYLMDGQERVAYEAVVAEKKDYYIYDITRELTSATVYPGDTGPTLKRVKDMSNGDECNVTDLNMCVHNATHLDAPKHFVKDGAAIDAISLYKCMGSAYVLESQSDVDARFVEENVPVDCTRLLIKGNVHFAKGVAKILAERGIVLIGCENQSISRPECSVEVHRELLSEAIVVLEGIDLSLVKEGVYDLCALPLKIKGCEGSPCRAVLIER